MSDSDTPPVPRKTQPKPRPRRMVKTRTDSIGSPTATSPSGTLSPTTASTSSPPQARRRIEDDFFSKAKNYREVVKVQAETFLHESEPETTEISALEPIPTTDEIPILDFEDEARSIEKTVQEEKAESETKRKREVSLTPPPELPIRQYPPTMPIPTMRIEVPPVVIDLDGPTESTDADIEPELDPELVSIAAKFTYSSQQTSSASLSSSQHDDGSTISCSLTSGGSFNSSEPSSSLDGSSFPSNTLLTPPSEVKLLIRLLAFPPRSATSEQEDAVQVPGKSLKVTVEEDTSFRMAMRLYCQQMSLDFSKVVFTYKKSRLIPSSTPRSLQFPAIAVVDVYETGAYKYMREIETRKLEELDRQAQELAELQDTLSNPNGQEDEGGQEQKHEEEEEEVEYLHIKLRGKDTADEKIRVKKTTTVYSILTHYKTIKKIPEGTLVQLELDDEVIDPSTTIGNTDVEDDDMLVVRVG
ncbi:Protein esc2 [Mortierella sp. AD094]|nr:Protein esc2 [Mortierella sp. AD094]